MDRQLSGRPALALFGSVIAFGAYFTLVGRIGASKAAYSTLLFPLVALSISIVYEGYVWHSNAVIGLALILLGNGDVCQTGTAVAAPKAGLRRLKKTAPSSDGAGTINAERIEFNGVDRHIIDNLLQGIDGQRCILIRRVLPSPLRTTLMTGLLVLASMTSASKYRSVSMVRWPVAARVPATIIATGITS